MMSAGTGAGAVTAFYNARPVPMVSAGAVARNRRTEDHGAVTSVAVARPHRSPAVAVTLSAVAFSVVMLGTTLPTPLYPRYEHRFGFGSLTVTLVFAAYAVGVLLALTLFGRASDTVGRRPMLLVGLGCAAASSVVFIVAGGAHGAGLTLLFVGRVLSGASAGLFTGTATATISDFAGPDRQRAGTVVAAVANIGGLGLGPLVAGLLSRYAVHPLQLSYAVHLVLVAAAAAAILAVPEPVTTTRPRVWRYEPLQVPAAARTAFVQAGTASFTGFALLGLFTAVSPAVLELLGHSSPVLTGVVVFAVFAASAGGQVISSWIPTRPALLVGTATLLVGLALVAASLAQRSLTLLVAAALIGGVGQGLSFRAALGLVTGASPAEQRGSVASSFFAVAYVGISIPVVGIGVGTRAWGLVHSGEAFAAILSLLAILVLLSQAAPRASGHFHQEKAA